MSIHVASLVWKTELGGPTVKAVAMKLADCAHDDGSSIYPAVTTIARETEVSERTVQRMLRELVDGPLRLLVPVKDGGGRSTPTVYRFDMVRLMELHVITQEKWAREKGDNLTSFRKRKGVTESGNGDTESRKGDTVTPEPSRTIKNLKSDFNSQFEEKKMAVRPAISVTRDKNPGAFGQWIAYLKDLGRDDLAKAADLAGELVAASRYPKNDSPLPVIDQSRAQIARTTGEKVA